MYAVYGIVYISGSYGEFNTVFTEEGYSSKTEAEYRAEELNKKAQEKRTNVYYHIGYYVPREQHRGF